MKKTLLTASVGALALAAAASTGSHAQTGNAYIGDTIMVGYTFCPQGYADADGQLLPIAQNQALFSLIGCTYGGDCRTSMALPDLRGRIPIQHGQGNGLTNHNLGARGGMENYTLNITQLPNHRHSLMATNAGNNAVSPQNNAFTTLTGTGQAAYNTGVDIAFENDVVAHSGGNQSFNVMSASLGIRYCVALYGLYPSRN